MQIGLLIYGSLDNLSGGFLYDRRLVASLLTQGDSVQIISLPWRNYAAHLTDNLTFRLPAGLDILIQDELNHPSLLWANHQPHPYPIISLVHHLRSSEQRPAWQNAFYRQAERSYLHSVDGFIFNSQTTKQAVLRLTDNNPLHIVTFPPTDRFGQALLPEAVSERAQAAGPLRVVFLGNLIPRKGLHTLLAAFSQQIDALHLDVVGSHVADPAYARAVLAQTSTLGLESRVRFHGPLADDALADLLASAQVLAVPSTYEGYGIVYLEGMGFGLPAIGTTAGAASEIISDGLNGYLIPPNDPQALAARLYTLAVDRDLLARLSRNALERYRKQPAWEETATSIRHFLLDFINKDQ